MPYRPACALLQHTKVSDVPSDLDITPTFVNYNHKYRDTVPVHIKNITTRTVNIQPKATVCEIQLVTIADIQLDISDDNKENLFNKLEVPTELSKDEVKNVKKLISAYEDVFSKNDTDIGFTS